VEIALPDLAEAQHKAVRALAYGLHIFPDVIAENLPGKVVPLSFDQQKQFALEALRFSDGSTWKEISAGKGKVFWSSYSAGLAEGLDPAVALYGYVLEALKIKPISTCNRRFRPAFSFTPRNCRILSFISWNRRT
jgi:hypothetical protein